MNPFTIDNPILDAAITQSPDGLQFSTEASDMGLLSWPKELSYKGVVYSNPQKLIDQGGETYAMEYRNGLRKFTLWND